MQEEPKTKAMPLNVESSHGTSTSAGGLSRMSTKDMVGSHESSQKDSTIFDRLTAGVIHVQRLLSEWVLVALTVAIAAEVVCRSFLGFSLLVVEEVAGYLLVALVFLGMGIATHENSLFRVEFVIQAVGPKVREVLLIAYRLLCFGFTLILLQQMYRLVIDSYERKVSAATTLAAPLYLPQIVLVVGAATLALVLLAQVLQSVRRFRKSLK